MRQFYILTKFAEGIEMGSECFGRHDDALVHLHQYGVINGPEYAIVEVKEWHKKVSEPHWTTYQP